VNDFITLIHDPNFYNELIDFLGPFGFLVGILTTFIEALIPPLPLALLVTINVLHFGFLLGYVLSYIGTVLGSFCVFLIFERLDRKFMSKVIEKHTRFKSLLHWIHEKGVFPLFVLLTFPFTPSVIVGILAALAEIDRKKYFFALLGGKLIMVFSLSFIGYNVGAFLQHPIRSSILILITLSITLGAKFIFAHYEKHVLRHKHIKK
jgi:uncharacterized membrane protein YdjX (TVP38/TMEM64 family)